MLKLYTSVICSLLFITVSLAQSTYLPLSTDEYKLIDRVEASTGAVNPYLNTTLKPYARSFAVGMLTEYQDIARNQLNSTTNNIDDYNIQRAISISGEWGKPSIDDDATIRSRRPILKYFYQTQPNFIHYSDEQNFFVVNPVLYMQAGYENEYNTDKYIFSRGAEIRARLFHKIGFYTMVAEHQEKLPFHIKENAIAWKAFPGFDNFKGGRSTAYDAFMTRAYIDFPIYKHHVQATFGYDKQFIGDGIRSLFISNTGAPNTFIRFRAHVGRMHYQSLFMELMPDYYDALDRSIPRKYASMQYLSFQLGNRFSLGLFESTIFNPSHKVHPTNVIPIILYQTAQQALAPRGQQTSLGFNFKYIPSTDVQLYGQAFINDIDFSQIGNNYYNNRYATQIGVKYFNAFTLQNLDVQFEWNFIRPFTYASMERHSNNYTHYNQPLAHPMESGFNELLAQAYYQPIPKLGIQAKAMYMIKAKEDMNGNEGTRIFVPIQDRKRDENFLGIWNNKVSSWNGLYLNVHGQYEVKTNIYFELGGSIYKNNNMMISSPTYYLYGGIRYNIARMEYDWL